MMVPSVEAKSAVSPADQVREANERLATGDTEAALALLHPLASGNAPYVPALFLLSMAAWKMGRLDWSLDLMRKCSELTPMDGTVAEVLASLQAQAGNLQESLFMGKMATALGGLGELAGLIPPTFPTFDFAFYTIKERPKRAAAKASLANGKLDDAIENARQDFALNPRDGEAREFLASLLFRAGRAGSAVATLRAAEATEAGGDEFSASYANLYAKALAAAGEPLQARDWQDKAHIAAAEDPAIAAAAISNGAWLARSAEEVMAAGADWARRFVAAAKPRRWQRPEGKLVIGYLVADFLDREDMAAVAAVARSHDRNSVRVVGYGMGAQTWDANLLFRGAFDSWHDVSLLDPATLARFFEREGLHAVIDAAGFAAPRGLLALARLDTAVRVSWLGNPAALKQPVYDAQIASVGIVPSASPVWQVAGGYPILPIGEQPQLHVVRQETQFGADVSMAQLDEATIRLWSDVLKAKPRAKLLLRGEDLRFSENVDRLVTRFGRDLASRIDLVEDESAAEFYRVVDLALTPLRGVSPRMAAEALAHGVPVVTLDRQSAIEPYAAFLHGLGLGNLSVARDNEEYVRMALVLSESGGARQETLETIKSASILGNAHDFAAAIEQKASALLTSIGESGS